MIILNTYEAKVYSTLCRPGHGGNNIYRSPTKRQFLEAIKEFQEDTAVSNAENYYALQAYVEGLLSGD